MTVEFDKREDIEIPKLFTTEDGTEVKVTQYIPICIHIDSPEMRELLESKEAKVYIKGMNVWARKLQRMIERELGQ